jgi:tRNA threonylcarbamoyladenosine biosynthesis protein TsaB
MPSLMDSYSVAIETSCRQGGLALGKGDTLLDVLEFPANQRHATQLVARMDDLLGRHGLKPQDLGEVYISAGPGSFTGLRVGVTVARTMAQALGLACVAVPTIDAVALNAADQSFEHLAVAMDYKEQTLYLALYSRQGGDIVPVSPPQLAKVEEVASLVPAPALLIGEAAMFADLSGPGITVGPAELFFPRPSGIWQIGRRIAKAGGAIDYRQLQPLYLRKPEAIRLWEKQGKP